MVIYILKAAKTILHIAVEYPAHILYSGQGLMFQNSLWNHAHFRLF